MTPITDTSMIQQMFQAYTDSTGFNVRFNLAWERVLFDCAQMGLTPEMIVLVVRDRQKGIKRGDRKPACLMPRNLFYGEDIVNDVICEAAAIMALKRKIIIDPARASVLQATGRASDHGEPEQGPRLAKNLIVGAIQKAVGE